MLLAGLVPAAVSVSFLHSTSIWSTSIWFLALRAHYGWSLSHLTAPLSIASAFGLLAPVVGYLTDRYGPRRLVLTGLCIFAAGLVLFGLIQGLPSYYASSIIMLVGVELCGWIPLVVMMSRWFARRRAFAIAIFLTVPDVLRAPLVPLITWSAGLETFWPGWRITAFILAGIVAVLAALTFSKMHNAPWDSVNFGVNDMDLLPDGVPELRRHAVRAAEYPGA